MKINFDNDIKTLFRFRGHWPTENLKDETMIFSGDLGFAYRNGGALTKMVVNKLDQLRSWHVAHGSMPDDMHVVIDTRVTMTFPGQYPSIPGWHCDDVPRNDKWSQPDFTKCNDRTQHFLVLFSDSPSVSCTEFVSEKTELEVDPENVWNSVTQQIEELKPKTGFLSTGELIQFGQKVIHRASPCKTAGWRYFFRASITHRKPVNEIRNQVQVYAPVSGGW